MAKAENLVKVQIEETKGINEIKHGLHIDFANKYIGGGVLGSGCV